MKYRLLIFTLLTSIAGFAQKATVTGTIFDKDQPGMTLPFANVLIKGTTNGTTTDENGIYTLKLDPGTYTLEFSFVGYEPLEETVTLTPGQTVTIDKTLGSGSYTIQDVVVQQQNNREKETALLLEQKNAVEIKQSIGAQELSRKGVSNVEGGVTKISGVSKVADRGIFIRGLDDRYNYLQINGLNFVPSDPNLKTIPLSFIPTDVVRNIDVYKTFNTSLYQDFAGASVNILTKDVPKTAYTKVSISAGFNTNTAMKDFKMNDEGGGDFWGYTGNNRTLPSVFQDKGTLYDATPAESKELFKSSWTPDRDKAPLNTAFSITNGDSFSIDDDRRIGYLFNVNFSNNYMAQTGERRNLNSEGTAVKDFQVANWKYTTQKSALASLNLKKFDKYDFFLNLIYFQNSENTIDEIQGENTDFITIDRPFFLRDMKYIENTSIGFQQLGSIFFKEKRHKLEYGIAATMGKNDMPDRKILITEGVGQDADYVTFNGADPFRYFSELENLNANGKIEYEINFGREVGAKRLHSARIGVNTDYTLYQFFNRTIRTKRGNGLTDTNLDTDNPQPFFNTNFDAGNLSYSGIADATFENEIMQFTQGGFVNYTRNGEKLIFDLGVRVEYQFRETKYRLESDRATDPYRTDLYDPIDFSPVLNLKYLLNDNSNVRFTASKTSTKPRVREILPFRYQDGDGNFTIGNPNIKNTQNYNVDLKFETFPQQNTYLAAGIFAKHIIDPISRLLEGTSTGFLTKYDNFDEANIFGLEIETAIGMDYFFGESDIAKRASIGVNTIFMKSDEKADKTKFPRLTSSSRSLQGASDFIINADASYEIATSDRFASKASIIYNTFSERIYAVGTDGASDIKQQPIHQLDFTWRNTFSKKYQLNLTVRNILDSEFLSTQDPTGTIANPDAFSNTSNRLTQGVNFALEFAYTF